jgi:hypothetical protein
MLYAAAGAGGRAVPSAATISLIAAFNGSNSTGQNHFGTAPHAQRALVVGPFQQGGDLATRELPDDRSD